MYIYYVYIYILYVYSSSMITRYTQQYLKEDLLILSVYLTLSFSLIICFIFFYLFSNSHAQRHITSLIYNVYRIHEVFAL